MFSETKQTLEDFKKYLRRSMLLLIYESLERTRRFWSFKFQELVRHGLEAKHNTEIIIEKNRMQLTISVEIPEAYIEETLMETIKSRERTQGRKPMWGEEIKTEEELKKEEEEDKEIEEVEVVEGT